MENTPIEVLHYLADTCLASRDRASLSATCTSLSPLRLALFKKIRLSEMDYTASDGSWGPSLVDLLLKNTEICKYIRDLEVMGHLPSPLPLTCIDVLSSMTSVQKLHMSIPWSDPYSNSIELENSLIRLVTLPTLQHLTLRQYSSIPIVKITNAFRSQLQPINDILLFDCKFTLREIQAHVLGSIPAPSIWNPMNPSPRNDKARKVAQEQFWTLSESLAPIHTGHRWLPTNMEVRECKGFWRDMSPYFDASSLQVLTINWPPEDLSDFSIWKIPRLHHLRLDVPVDGVLEPFTKYKMPPCAQLTVVIDINNAWRPVFQRLPEFLSAADVCTEINIKIIAKGTVVQKIATTRDGHLIRQAFLGTNHATTLLTLGISIAHYSILNQPSQHRYSHPWGEVSHYSEWFNSIHKSLQSFLPHEGEHPEQTFKTGLFYEAGTPMYWVLTPSLDADARSTIPAWFNN